ILDRPFLLGMLAEVHGRLGHADAGLRVVDEALTLEGEFHEHWWNAEIHRLKGELLVSLTKGNAATAEECYERAIKAARSQGAKSLELRSSTSLARLWHLQGKVKAARELLAPIYAWFTEGFDTPDLKDAKALLDQLS